MKKIIPRFRRAHVSILTFVALIALAGNTFTLAADATNSVALPFVSPMFGDNMVLQRGKPVKFWGWAKSAEQVRVELAGQTATAISGSRMAAGRRKSRPPRPEDRTRLKLSGRDKPWCCTKFWWVTSGCAADSQTWNLAWAGRETASRKSKRRTIRKSGSSSFSQHVAYSPAAVLQGTWKICSPQTVAEGADGGFSAVAYFFGRKLQDELHVPIGLIEDCLGGTPAESWMSPETLHQLKDFDAPLAEIERLHAKGGPEYGSFLMHWLDEYDVGSQSNTWAAADLDDSGWKPVQIPGGFQELGVADVPSVCWFRKEFTLPDPLPRGPGDDIALARLKRWIPPTSTASGSAPVPGWRIPGRMGSKTGVLKPGRNVLAVRVFKLKPQGGFLAKAGHASSGAGRRNRDSAGRRMERRLEC